MSESDNQSHRESITNSLENYSLHGQSTATEEDLSYHTTQRSRQLTIEDLINQVTALQIQVAALSANQNLTGSSVNQPLGRNFGSPVPPRAVTQVPNQVFVPALLNTSRNNPIEPVIAVLAEFQVRDQVQIRNPRGRPNRATVTGFTRTGLVRLLLSDGTYSRRATQNLRLISRPE